MFKSKTRARKPIVHGPGVILGKRGERKSTADSQVDPILDLQRKIGNGAVQRLFESGAVRAKPQISQPGDAYEQEADRMAAQVMQMPAEPQIASTENVDRNSEIGSESPVPGLRGGGRPLREAERDFFEPRLGLDLGQVRVHDYSEAARVAREMGARAFTTGRDIVFARGEYAPETSKGKALLAHELAHVVQRSVGGRAGARLPRLAKVSQSAPPPGLVLAIRQPAHICERLRWQYTQMIRELERIERRVRSIQEERRDGQDALRRNRTNVDFWRTEQYWERRFAQLQAEMERLEARRRQIQQRMQRVRQEFQRQCGDILPEWPPPRG